MSSLLKPTQRVAGKDFRFGQSQAIGTSVIEKKLNQVILLHQTGNLDEAEAQYLEILLNHPNHADVLQLLGTLYAQKLQPDKALEYFKKSLEINPQQAIVLNNLGNVYSDLKLYDKALECYENAIRLQNNYAQAWHNKGNIYFSLKDYSNSFESYKVAVQLNPTDSQNFNHLANAQQELSMYADAFTSYEEAIKLNPNNSEAFNNLGVLQLKNLQFDLALKNFDQAIEIQPLDAQVHYNRGRALKSLNRIQESIDSFCRAIELKADYFEAYNNLGNVLKDENDLENAFSLYSKVIEIKPDYAQAYFNRGVILQEFNELDQAELNYEMALSLEPSYADAHLNLGLISLMREDYEKGWGHYDWRFKSERLNIKFLESNRPQWDFSSSTILNKRLLIWSEQGVGDELMFCSLLPELIARFKSISLLVQVDERLLPLMRRSIEGAKFIAKNQEIIDQDFDNQMSLGQLASFLRPSAESFINQKVSYLLPDKERTKDLYQNLHPQHYSNKALHKVLPFQKTIGISWRSNAPKTGLQRSLSLSELALAIYKPGVRLISLQYGEVQEEIGICLSKTGVTTEVVAGINNFTDLDGLAALMHVCDEIVSIDNITVHLAASMGLKVKVLLPFHPDWRWGLSNLKSVWYPSIELIRQAVPGDWSSVLLELEKQINLT
jgi:tetratricopeptide (TPR) repeat protein